MFAVAVDDGLMCGFLCGNGIGKRCEIHPNVHHIISLVRIGNSQ